MTAPPEFDPRHVPVLRAEVLAALMPAPGRIVVDATFGLGGYARAFLEAGAEVIAIDRDPHAIEAGAPLAARFEGRLRLIEGRFGALPVLVGQVTTKPVDAVAFDLGVSSPQLDEAGRGFSFRLDGPLDMRMGADGPSAADLVNQAGEAELADILFTYGEERRSRRIARAIVEARAAKPIMRTLELAEIIRRASPRSANGIDPATRTFQALRIAVNDELGELERGLSGAEAILRPGGRLAVVSFHSLEDRAVKLFLRARSEAPTVSRHMPEAKSAARPSFRLVSKRPVTPGETEIAANPRARSARLRVAERLGAEVA